MPKNSCWAFEQNRTADLFLTKEVLYHWATKAFFKADIEREIGLEPTTYSLEGYRSTKWATPAYFNLIVELDHL